jgi:hypothetical protein
MLEYDGRKVEHARHSERTHHDSPWQNAELGAYSREFMSHSNMQRTRNRAQLASVQAEGTPP